MKIFFSLVTAVCVQQNPFTNSFDLDSLIDSRICYEPVSPTCIDLILTNIKNLFMRCATFESGVCDHYKLTTTLLRKTISKGNSKKKVQQRLQEI